MPVYVDINRCIGCRSCEVACKRAHSGRSYVEVKIIDDRASVPVMCHHCEEANCTLACFSGALTKDGARTAFDIHKCTGCGLCALACPFGVVWTDKIAHKCDLCGGAEVLACVATCPAQALSKDQEVAAKRARARAAVAAVQGGRR
jgi:formate dehydrogenase iron-sulfur subunit